MIEEQRAKPVNNPLHGGPGSGMPGDREERYTGYKEKLREAKNR